MAFCMRVRKAGVLSPAYDLNPVPVDVKPRVLSTAVNTQAARLGLSSTEIASMASAF